jgi:hypothetical protein
MDSLVRNFETLFPLKNSAINDHGRMCVTSSAALENKGIPGWINEHAARCWSAILN